LCLSETLLYKKSFCIGADNTEKYLTK